jgi:hypothetical protein
MPTLEAYLFFLLLAAFFFATDRALLSTGIAGGLDLAPRFRIYDTVYFFPAGKPRKFQET